MRQTKRLLALFLVAALVSCTPTKSETTPFSSPSPSSTVQSPTDVFATPSFTISFQPDEQVYTDPEGWFSLAFPAQWTKESEWSYKGSNGFIEIGYLPEYAFAPYALTVCESLANIDTKNIYTVSWMGTSGIGGCQLLSRSGNSPATIWAVAENPSADFAHRFFYIKADNTNFGRITSTFTWFRPVEEKKKPDFSQAELRSEDVAFWSNTISLPSSFSLSEHALAIEYQSEDPSEKIFLNFVAPEILPTQSSSHQSYSPATVESVNQSLEKHGYKLQQGDVAHLYDLYQNGTKALQNIYQLPKIYLFQTEYDERLVFFAHTLVDSKQSPYTEGNIVSYLVQDEKITVWEKAVLNPMYSGWTPIWVEDKPLFLGLGDGVTLQVLNVQHEIVYTFATYFGTHVPIKKFQAWDEHWILEVSNFVVQDGVIFNEKFKFEEVFNWSLINKKPFYFFRKGPRVGFSYDGQFFSTYYDEIVHGYCCGLALNNPMVRDNVIRFFGKRGGVWHYVVLEIQ